MTILRSDLDYAFGQTAMRGHFAVAADGPAKRPGILIFPDAFGLDDYCIGVADRLAALGYAALAADLWGERCVFAALEAGAAATAALLAEPETWMGRADAARQALLAQAGVDASGIAAIGYCLGGSTVLELARRGADLAGAVSFHGGLDFVGAEWDADRVKAKLLVCTGVEDPLVPWSSVTAFQANVRKGGVNWELDVYSQAKHSFTRPDATQRSSPERVGYDPQADRRSWRAALDFLDEIFGAGR